MSLDYDLKNGNILFNSIYSHSDRDGIRRRRRYRIETSYQQFDTREYERFIDLFSNTLSGDHNLGIFNIFWRTSYNTSNNKTPLPTVRFSGKQPPFLHP